MSFEDQYCCTASAEVLVPAAVAFAYMADGVRMGEWTLGSWNRRRISERLFVGTSLFDNTETYVEVQQHRDLLLIDYAVGKSPQRLVRCVSTRIVPGELCGRGPESCLVTLMAWRLPDQSDDDWRRVYQSYAVELPMIKGRLELGF